jgi:putative ABC transport system permease protein
VAQVSVSLLLLVGAGFFVRSFQRSAQVDMGFRVDHVLMGSVDLQGYSKERGQQFYRELRERLKAHTGVRDAAISAFVPMGYENALINVYPQGRVSNDQSETESVMSDSVQPEFFRTLGVSVIRGRPFDASDTVVSPRVAIINEEFAHKIWPNQDPIGKTFQTERNGPLIQVIGMTPTGKYNFLYEPPFPYVYFPLVQRYTPAATIFIYTDGDAQRATTLLRQEVSRLDPTLPLYDVMAMESHVRYGKPLLPARLGAMLVGTFGLLGLVLASVGVYGVISYSVSQRTQELGIRSALGAGPRNLIALVIRQGMSLTLIGLGIGLVLGAVLLRGLHAVLYGVGFTDLPIFAIVSTLLVAVAFLATYLPARRATKIDPMIALRCE